MSVSDWIRFQQVFGFGTTRAVNAMKQWHTPFSFFEVDEADWRRKGLTDTECDRARAAKKFDTEPILEYCERNAVRIFTPDSAEYPDRLRHIYNPPSVLYVAGSWPDLDRVLAIAIVGTRRCTAYGDRVARQLSEELAHCGVVTVSGLAAGIDTCCHDATVKAGGRTIAVQGCGIDITYPASNRKLKEQIICSGGAVISEFPPGMEPFAHHFPIRNRIIAGLSCGTVVVEGEQHSGSLITAGIALSENRDVFAVPGGIDQQMSQAPNRLIHDGAIMVRDVSDILAEYDLEEYRISRPNVQNEGKTPQQLSLFEGNMGVSKANTCTASRSKAPAPLQQLDHLNEAQRTVLAAMSSDPMNTDEIVEKCELPVSTVLSVLTQLEIFGIIKIHAGHRYSR